MRVEERKSVLRFGNFELHEAAGELRKHGIKIKLQQKPLQILRILLEHPGEVVSREQLQRALWPDGVFVDFDHGLNTAIKKLRDALGDTAASPRYIATVDRQGYRFLAPVTTEDLGPPAANGTPAAPAVLPAYGELPVGRSRRGWFAVVAACAIIALAGWLYFQRPRSAPLTETDTVLLGEFTNSTGDPVFDGTLKQALGISLRQSPFLEFVSDAKVADVLKEMTRPADTPLTPEVAREVCQRAGAKASIEGAVAALGSDYVIGLKAVNCGTGAVLASEQATVASKEQIIAGLGGIATKLRSELGESLASVQKYDVPLQEATTSSLDALKAYSLAKVVFDRGDYQAAIPLFKHAVELDPNFAQAYESVGISLSNASQNDEAQDWIRKAYQMRRRASQREQLLITTAYYNVVTQQVDKRIETLRMMRQLYPRDVASANNLAAELTQCGRFEEALQQAQDTVRMAPTLHTGYELLGIAYLGLNRWQEAHQVREKEMALHVDYHWDHFDLYNIGYWQHDPAEMQRQVEWAKGNRYESFLWNAMAGEAAAEGRLRRSLQLFRKAQAGALQAGLHSSAEQTAAEGELMQVLLGMPRPAVSMPKGASDSTLRFVGLADALQGKTQAAGAVMTEMLRRYPESTYVNKVWVPAIRAELALHRGAPEEAIQLLQPAAGYEFGWRTQNWANYIRGRAFLRAGRPEAAAAEFQKILDHPGICLAGTLAPLPYNLSYLELGRALSKTSDVAGARRAYQQFLAAWGSADPGLPLLRQAREELSRLGSGH